MKAKNLDEANVLSLIMGMLHNKSDIIQRLLKKISAKIGISNTDEESQDDIESLPSDYALNWDDDWTCEVYPRIITRKERNFTDA